MSLTIIGFWCNSLTLTELHQLKLHWDCNFKGDIPIWMLDELITVGNNKYTSLRKYKPPQWTISNSCKMCGLLAFSLWPLAKAFHGRAGQINPPSPSHSYPSVSSAILDSPRAEQRRAYSSTLHWGRVHLDSSSSPVVINKWRQGWLSEPVATFSDPVDILSRST